MVPNRQRPQASTLARQGIEARIDQILLPFKRRNVPIGWTIGPTTQPPDLGAYLAARGFTLAASQTAHSMDLAAMQQRAPVPANFHMTEVADLASFKQWRQVSDTGFAASEQISTLYHGAYLALGWEAHLPWRHFLGWLGDEPVAAATLLLHAGIAGIYGVATIPSARRQGVGAAMTLAPMQEARARGYRIAILFPSDEGLRMYQGLGFQAHCTLHHWVWSP